MKIEQVHLVNIKSYVDETVSFREGINCILGLNGSGKSTLIEAIGVGLFNYNRYRNINQMIRYQEKRGLIEIDFIGEDNRRYQVSRTLRTQGGSVQIVDLETDAIVCEQTENVYPFIKKVLKISKTKEFSKMFEEIIAVPQGEFVNAFLQTPANRRDNFDKLFELHIYKETANKLKDLNDFLKENYIIVLEKEIIDLDAQIKPYDDRKQQEKMLVIELEKMQKNLKKSINILTELKSKKDNFEIIKKQLNDAHNMLLVTQEKQQMIEVDLIAKSQDLHQSEDAQTLLNETKNQYLKHQENTKKIIQLERQFDEALALEKQAQEFEKTIDIALTNISHFEEQIQQQEEEAKSKKVSEESTKSKALINQTTVGKLEENVRKLEEDLQNYKQDLEQKKLAFEDHQQQHIYYETKAEIIPQYDHNYQTIIKENIQKIREKINQNDDLIIQLKALEKERNFLENDFEKAQQNAALSVDGMCPFLKSTCKNINEESLTSYFENIAREIHQKTDHLDTQIQSIKQQINDEKELAISLAEELKKLDIFDQTKQMKASLISEVKRTFFEDNLLPDQSLELYLDMVKKQLVEKRKLIESLTQQTSTLEQELTQQKTQVNTKKFELKQLEILALDLEKELKKITADIRDFEAKRIRQKRLKEEAQSQLIAVKKASENGSHIKLQLDGLKQENVELEEAKNIYIANEKKAKEWSTITIVLQKAQTEKEVLMEKEQGLKAAIQQLNKQYSDKTYDQVVKEHQALIEAVSGTKATIIEKEASLQEVQKVIALMEQLILQQHDKVQQLKNRKKSSDFIQKMRKVYTELPPRLSAAYREYISIAATKLYRDISRENVGLEMTEDYQVRIVDGMNSDTYKTIEQLSGGEQMSVAIAIRLSMLRHLSGVNIYFLDEPTINLDSERRAQVASVIQEAAVELAQLFVISHDDTFDDITENIVKIVKMNNVSTKI